MRPFFENNVLQQQPFKPMIIVVDTTKAGSASNTFVLPIIKATTEAVKIYWGDGTSSIGVNGNNTHVYAASGIYTIKIESKIFGGLYFNNGGDKAKITKVVSFGHGVIRSLATSFYGCSSLLSIDTGDIVSNGVDATNLYRSCTSLATVPLFDLSSVTNAVAMFYQCTSLTSIPLFNLSKCTSARSMLAFCTSLATVPLFDLSSVTDAFSMFSNCTSLTSIPLFDLSKCTNTSYMFISCTSLTTIPLFDMSKVTDATAMFASCNSITTQSYSDFLINLATLPLKNGVSFHGGNSKYNVAGGVARAYLISNFGWTITDGGAA